VNLIAITASFQTRLTLNLSSAVVLATHFTYTLSFVAKITATTHGERATQFSTINAMKICVVQTKPVPGDIQRNIEHHKRLIDLAITNAANMVIFPELSLTGYEPTLAAALAIDQDDSRFDDFQRISDREQVTIGVGVPTTQPLGTCISLILFQPQQARQTVSKAWLHPDEEPFFVRGDGLPSLKIGKTTVALAICYELSVPEHAERAQQHGAEVYIASVAKSADGVVKASHRLSEIAQTYSMTVLMSNCVGPTDDFESAGHSAVWQRNGSLAGQLDATHEGLLIYDTATQELVKISL
jgi:predicted amidohydrolase